MRRTKSNLYLMFKSEKKKRRQEGNEDKRD